MKTQIIRLTPAVTLSVIPTTVFKTSYISFAFMKELDVKSATYNSLLMAVLFRGCRKYPDISAISIRCEELYGAGVAQALNVRGEYHCPGINLNYIDSKYAIDDTDIEGGAIELLSDILLDPLTENGVFCAEYVESEKKKLCAKIEAQKNNKTRYAITRATALMCENERYGTNPLGSIEQLESITPKSLWEYYQSLITTAAVRICYVGSGDPEKVSEKLGCAFASLSHTPLPLLPTEVIYGKRELREITEKEPVAQGKLTIGFRTGYTLSGEDYHVFALFNEVLGGSPTSKLFLNVREKESLCYYCASIPEAIKGVLFIASGIEVKNKEKAVRAIFNQIEAIANGDISADELDAAKKSIVNSYNELTDSCAGLAAWYFNRALANRDDSPEQAAKAVLEVSAEQISAVAKALVPEMIYFLEGTLAEESEAE